MGARIHLLRRICGPVDPRFAVRDPDSPAPGELVRLEIAPADLAPDRLLRQLRVPCDFLDRQQFFCHFRQRLHTDPAGAQAS